MANPDFSQAPLEAQPRAATDPQVAVPSLNIFLGSTPAFSALEAMRQLVYLPEPDRRRAAFVFLDIDAPPSELIQFRQEHPGALPEFDLRISVAHGVIYADALDGSVAHHTYIPTKIPESFDNGAGGIRNNGHVAACTDHARIVQVMDEALSALGALDHERGARPVTEIQINIVAFLGGGTGSGILPDIAVMIRHRVLQLNLKHRLNLFCLLPEHVREATTNDVSWRKSNAAATLLELVALSLASGDAARLNAAVGAGRPQANGHSPYVKYMLTAPYVVRGTTIANEVYLFGQTAMHSAEHAARIIGLDLFMRITNGSGVGFLERSKAVDRRTLGNYDARGLPTMFGTTCPLEVAFPAVETATAFAQLTAAKLLPLLAGERANEGYQLTPKEMDLVAEWDHALEQPPQPPFTEKQMQTAGRDRLDLLEARLKKQVAAVEEEVEDQARALEAKEMKALAAGRLDPIGQQVRRLQSRRRVYIAALNHIQDQRIPRPTAPDRILQRQMLKAWAIFGRKDKAVAAVTDDFNRVQRRNIKAVVLGARKELLQRLLDHVEEEQERLGRFQEKVESEDVTRRLEATARASAAWNGTLDNLHVHRRHIFDLPGMAGMEVDDDGSRPVKLLYELLTPEDGFDSLVEDFTDWLESKFGDEAALGALDAADLRGRLIQFLRDEVYLAAFAERNLFELVRECCVDAGERADEKVEKVLQAHLSHMSGLARKLVAFEDQLWTEGSSNLNTSFYLGMSWRTGAQRRLLDRAKDRISAVSRDGASPFLASAIDPHRMQLLYGQHGISLGTIPDFFQRSNSSMGEFAFHQAAWQGDASRPYGQSKAPVFSSGEMERLVMHSEALGYRQPLPERIVREHQVGAGNARPDWADAYANGSAMPRAAAPNGNGHAPAGDPAAYRAQVRARSAGAQPDPAARGGGGPAAYGGWGDDA
ncbi:MAG TPA: tubulin-like doman-containing protein [Ktedonobacterales bacterium]